MTEYALYNNKKFPEFVFSRKDISYLFIEFDTIFEVKFLSRLEQFLEKYNILKIIAENIEPKLYHFIEEIETNNFIESFKASTCTEQSQSYIKTLASFYMLTEQGLIYAKDRTNLFCVVLDRRFWIATVAVSNPADLHYFSEFSIGNVLDYLSMSFKNDVLTDAFKNTLLESWQ
ncbi:MAG: hypothetical protein WCF67_12560 [Chitinophagaceae bacterium]